MKYKTICVLGLGYIGLPTASMFATHGIKVIGVDVNQRVVDTLKQGKIHIHEPGLQTLVSAAIKSSNLIISDTPQEADAFIIAVPTPVYTKPPSLDDILDRKPPPTEKLADMEYVESAAEAIVPYLKKGDLVILESTSPPRTTLDLVAPILEGSGLKSGEDFDLAYSPERVLPGKILQELVENTRVVGGINRQSAEAGRDLYKVFVSSEIFLTDSTSAEMVKLMENTYRDVNIALANEFSRFAEMVEIDVWETIQLANKHPRVNILNPGPGVGGHCISVDPWFLVETSPELTPLITTAREVNDSQPEFVFERIKEILGDLVGKEIALLGMAYKPNVDDLRESPAIEVAKLCHDTAGIPCAINEPFNTDFKMSGIWSAPSWQEAVADSINLIVLLVGHQEFLDIDPVELKKLAPKAKILDTVNGWDREAFEKAGFTFYRLGDRKAAF